MLLQDRKHEELKNVCCFDKEILTVFRPSRCLLKTCMKPDMIFPAVSFHFGVRMCFCTKDLALSGVNNTKRF